MAGGESGLRSRNKLELLQEEAARRWSQNGGASGNAPGETGRGVCPNTEDRKRRSTEKPVPTWIERCYLAIVVFGLTMASAWYEIAF